MPLAGPVILFTSSLAGDGVARNTIYLANALARRGMAVEIVCLRGGLLSVDLCGPTVTCLGGPPWPRPLALAASIPALHRRLTHASVAVSMGNHAHLALWAALRGLPDLPRVYRISNEVNRGDERPLRRTLREAGLRIVAADATRLVCVSRAIGAAEPFRRLRRDRRLDILPNGVDAEAVRRKAAQPVRHAWIDQDAPYLVAVGRLHRQKNYEGLIEALARLRVAGQPDLRLLVLGAAPPKRRGALEARARHLGLEEAVRFEGEVANPFPLVARAATYVLPSLWEGASNSLLEAVACGVPVVASRTAGNAADVLGDGRYGVLADPTDVDDLARSIARQLDPATRVLPCNRVDTLGLDAVLARLERIVREVGFEHDGIQIRPATSGHVEQLSL